MQNTFQTILPCQNFSMFFFEKSIFFTVSTHILQSWDPKSQKKTFSVLFYSAKSNSDHFTISNFSSFSFKKLIFLLFRPPRLHRWEMWSQQKINFLCSFIVHYPSQTILPCQNFSMFFFRKINFFHCFGHYTAKVRNMSSEKKSFFGSFLVQNPFETILQFQKFSKFFLKKSIFFTVSTPILQRWETWSQQKITFSALL